MELRAALFLFLRNTSQNNSKNKIKIAYTESEPKRKEYLESPYDENITPIITVTSILIGYWEITSGQGP
jgi:hypothetical protein